MAKVGLCRFCGRERSLIKAHIFPVFFYRKIRANGETPTVYSSRETEFPKKAPIGVYDTGILCAECDGSLGVYDGYAKKILFDIPVLGPCESNARTLRDYDYSQLKLFFLALLWRSGISTHRMFEQVELGPHEDRLLAMLKAGDPGAPQDYAVAIFEFDDPDTLEIGLQTFRQRKPINLYRFNAGGYAIFIKVDAREMRQEMRKVILSPGQPLVVVKRSWRGSREYSDFMNVVASATLSVGGK